MGTRADFYISRGDDAVWIGSIAWDGYPDGIPKALLEATDREVYRRIVNEFLQDRDDATFPEDGWPWPWDDSQLTDFAYAFEKDAVYCSCFGNP